jgi:hypothetical protein
MPNWVKQRQSPRYLVQLPLLHQAKAPASSRVGVGWTRDLSEGGACLELTERFRPSMLLRVRLQTDGGPIELGARVVWAREPTAPRGGTLHGVAFTQVASDDRQALRDLIISKGQMREAGVRLPLHLSVTCRPKGQRGVALQGRTGNMSRGGLLVYLPQSLPPGTDLELTLHTPQGPLTAEGEIVWVEPPERRTPGEPIRQGCRLTARGWSTALSLGLLFAEPA